jgi:shikimate dehydrogenase
MSAIAGAPELYGLFGFPLGHSHSPELFQGFFQVHGLHAEYQLWPNQHSDNWKIWAEEHPRLRGFNVTIPHKVAIMSGLQLSPEAKAIGAVNCVSVQRSADSIWGIGYNTDAVGFWNDLQAWMPQLPSNALILGNGGSARAVSYALNPGDLLWHELDAHRLQDVHLIVQTTPLGMWPNSAELPPFNPDWLSPRHAVYDLIYNPAPSLFLSRAAEQGAQVRDGSGMLTQQALASLFIWKPELKPRP